VTAPVRIPADVDMEDRLLGRLTARQLVILGGTAAVLYLAWTALRAVVPVGVFLAAAAPVAAVAAALALGRRDGTSLDRLTLAAGRHYTSTRPPRHEATHPAVPGWLSHVAVPGPAGPDGPRRPLAPVQLPPRNVGNTGVVDLGEHGLAVVAVCSTVNFALRTPAEQDGLLAGFARYLHSLRAPVQALVRALPLDLSPRIAELHAAAPRLPHPALAAAAADHADYLSTLAEEYELLTRQVLLVFREPDPTRTPHGRRRGADQPEPSAQRGRAMRETETRLGRRLTEAGDLLAPVGITLTVLDADRAAAVLAAACHPGRLLPPTAPAHPGQIVTARRSR